MPDTTLIRGDIRVELEDIGEGWGGEWDPTDPTDEPLLRFTVSRRVGEDWEQIDDASYCTRIPATTDTAIAQRITAAIMEEVYDHAASGQSIKRTCERLSWLTAQDVPTGKYDWETND